MHSRPRWRTQRGMRRSLLSRGGARQIAGAEDPNADSPFHAARLRLAAAGGRLGIRLHTFGRGFLTKSHDVYRSCRNLVFHQIALHCPGAAAAEVEIVGWGDYAIVALPNANITSDLSTS